MDVCLTKYLHMFISVINVVYLYNVYLIILLLGFRLFIWLENCLSVSLLVCMSVCLVILLNMLRNYMMPSTRSIFAQILGLDSIDDFTWNQASLNIKLGGFGLSEVNKSKCLAYVSSWAQSVKDLPNSFFSLLQHIQTSGGKRFHVIFTWL